MPAQTDPFVRVVVLNYNGAHMTIECLMRLLDTDWPSERFEVVLVDNASNDGVADHVRRMFPEVTIITSPVNLGFAGGCNLGLRDLEEVDYVALINNDVMVQSEWLTPLVRTLAAEPSIGAACPRILFMDQYLDVHLTSTTTRRGKGDFRDLGVRIAGVRVGSEDVWNKTQFIKGFWGREKTTSEGNFQWTDSYSHLRLGLLRGSSAPTTCELLLAADSNVSVTLDSGGEIAHHVVGSEPRWCAVEVKGKPFDVINNVGSMLTEDFHGADRGYLEYAEGTYRDAADVFAWCGAAVVFPRRYIQEVGLFDERFFLYYEDLELSWRGHERGWRYRYVPDSIVFHHHSATTVEGSDLAEYYNLRNRLLTLMLHGSPRVLVTALIKYLLITGSYGRRDVLGPLLRGQTVQTETVQRRLKSFASALRLSPAMAHQRNIYRRRAKASGLGPKHSPDDRQ